MDSVAQELSIDLLLDLDQVTTEGVFDKSDALLFDAAAPARGLVGEADHVGRDSVEAGDVSGLIIASLDELSILWIE